MQGITFYCKKCRKSTRVTYRLTGNDEAPVLLNIDIVCHHCKRVMYLKKHGVPIYVEIELQRLRTLRKKIARELEIPEDDVTPKMISEWSQRSISEYEVRAILDITAIHKSMEQIMEEGIATDKAFRGTEDVETNAFDILDYDVRKVFDGFFTRLSEKSTLFL